MPDLRVPATMRPQKSRATELLCYSTGIYLSASLVGGFSKKAIMKKDDNEEGNGITNLCNILEKAWLLGHSLRDEHESCNKTSIYLSDKRQRDKGTKGLLSGNRAW